MIWGELKHQLKHYYWPFGVLGSVSHIFPSCSSRISTMSYTYPPL